MRIAFIGCVEFSWVLLRHVASAPDTEIVGIVTRQQSTFNADFRSLQPYAEEHGIPCFLDTQNNQAGMLEWLTVLKPDVVFCFGWPYLLHQDILTLPRLGVVGYHPTALPQNRGRHPIIWTLALGLTQTASTFFLMDEGADAGPILSQKAVPVSNEDDARDLYGKLLAVAEQQVLQLCHELVSGTYQATPQDSGRANYWRKRSKSDGVIDWRMSAASIHNLVRALAHPYPGAHCLVGGREIRIWKTDLPLHTSPSLANIEPGKVLATHGNAFDVKCGEGVIRVVEHEFSAVPNSGSYLT